MIVDETLKQPANSIGMNKLDPKAPEVREFENQVKRNEFFLLSSTSMPAAISYGIKGAFEACVGGLPGSGYLILEIAIHRIPPLGKLATPKWTR